MIDFVIRRFPPSSNNMYLNGRGGGRRVPTRELKLFKEFVGLEWGLTQQRAIPPFVKRVRVVLTFCPPSRRWYDVDNRVKPTLDALTEAGVWLDDKIVDQVDARKGDPVRGGAVVVEAFALGPQQRPILPPSLTPLPEPKNSRKNNKKEETQ